MSCDVKEDVSLLFLRDPGRFTVELNPALVVVFALFISCVGSALSLSPVCGLRVVAQLLQLPKAIVLPDSKYTFMFDNKSIIHEF